MPFNALASFLSLNLILKKLLRNLYLATPHHPYAILHNFVYFAGHYKSRNLLPNLLRNIRRSRPKQEIRPRRKGGTPIAQVNPWRASNRFSSIRTGLFVP